MNSSKAETEKAIQLIQEKMQQAKEQLEQTYNEEFRKRMEIIDTEKKLESRFEEMQFGFEEATKQKFQNNPFNDLNIQLKEALENDDVQLIQEILKKMSEL